MIVQGYAPTAGGKISNLTVRKFALNYLGEHLSYSNSVDLNN